MNDSNYLGLYGRLIDRFGDNGLVSVVLGRLVGVDLHLDLWLMSCRVLKRDMEVAMLDAVVSAAKLKGVERVIGYYKPTKKNAMVADHYAGLEFLNLARDASTGESTWSLSTATYVPRTRHMRIKGAPNG